MIQSILLSIDNEHGSNMYTLLGSGEPENGDPRQWAKAIDQKEWTWHHIFTQHGGSLTWKHYFRWTHSYPIWNFLLLTLGSPTFSSSSVSLHITTLLLRPKLLGVSLWKFDHWLCSSPSADFSFCYSSF